MAMRRNRLATKVIWDFYKGNRRSTLNSRGQRKPILEEGWAEAGSQVTHAVLQITAGSCGAFVGALGNTLWVDNVRMEYAQ